MSAPYRTPTGGRIDRRAARRFWFDGRSFEGLEGDTLASALLSHGIHFVGRSFKYHRPRGFLAAGSEEPNALAVIDRGTGRETPNLRMTQVELYEGLEARSQNHWPSLFYDVGAINGMLAPIFAAGFYYKTFMGPRFMRGPGVWTKLFEPAIRRAAGLGPAPTAPDPDIYAGRFAHCDVLVVGAGPAGLAATLAAARAGKRVILCDEGSEFGGSLLSEPHLTIDGQPAADWLLAALANLGAMANVTLLPRTQAFGYYGHNLVALTERLTDHLASNDRPTPRERMWQVRAKEVVLATGAIERPLVFPGNDRPGVMLAGSARVFLNRYGVKVGHRVLVATAHDSAYRAALDLRAAGAEIAAILDLRQHPSGPLVAEAEAVGIRILRGATVTGTKGYWRVSEATVGHVSGEYVTDLETIACDALLMSGGWTPSIHLFSQSRGVVAFDEASGMFLPDKAVQAQRSVGGCRGVFGIADALSDGDATGRPFTVLGDDQHGPGGFIGALPQTGDGARAKAFVDFQNDVTAKDIKLATREGFRSIEHIKRYTTTGMATDQGKTSNLNALAIAAKALNEPVPAVGLTTFRQPFTPVTFGSFAGMSRGQLFDPIRKTPIHDWAVARGARFEDVALWKRAHYFPEAGEDMHAAVARECRRTRESAGLFDASTLGKIEVVGPDAAEFLNRLYPNAWLKLGVGRCRYGLMLNEAGFVMDDGVVGRLSQDRFHVTTTTGGAPRVLAHMEDYLQTEFPDLKVWLTSTTDQWAVIAVQGPRARDILAPLIEDVDLAPAAMPHMAIREGHIGGVPMRLFRVSFTGELGFEVNVPADYGRAVWEAIWAEAKRYDAVAYGTEAMHVLRAEKGYIIVGQETDGTATPDDVGLGGMISASKPDFVGKRSLARPFLMEAGRKQLVGLLTLDPTVVLDEGAQVVPVSDAPIGTHAIGNVTSSYASAVLGRSIAIAMVEGGRARLGETIYIPMASGSIVAKVTTPVFYDPQGERLNG
ncbi:sarcosine oxidase subunit alpha family protein [Lichenihabitans psoromatis]|uniref:sarcosine oxidase subunit alpha family protein n=1 Tax=Lichenihabitans psoromatis TaxID=2528642 RepID=UPI001036A353|nr:sarcosine oxidase subunit alpha family protein [Lichenihabitans psoromatis]